jgi:hypothetical protein
MIDNLDLPNKLFYALAEAKGYLQATYRENPKRKGADDTANKLAILIAAYSEWHTRNLYSLIRLDCKHCCRGITAGEGICKECGGTRYEERRKREVK